VTKGEFYHLFEATPGSCGVAWSAAGLTRIQLPEATATETGARLTAKGCAPWIGPPPSEIAACIDLLKAYFAGEPVDFLSITLDMTGLSSFEIDVYQALRRVGYGQTTSYGALANQVGSPEAAQAIGMAMGRNPWPIIVPCHRVLAAARKIGGFTAPGGITTKRKLLGMESRHMTSEQDLFG
jgi:methylated-DNA-[protein]-cysteine S-methyltransferase